jgi:hypothetical protein
MSALIDPDDDPIERCSELCLEVSFLLKQDAFAVEYAGLHDQMDDIPFQTTVREHYHTLEYTYML